MYKNTYGGSRGGSSRYSGGGSRFNNRGSFGRSPRRQSGYGQNMPDSHFVNKAVAPIDEVEYTATHQFADFEIAEELKARISQKGYTTPTPIQDQTIPFILSGLDVIGVAQTGTGKTGAFLIPLIHKTLIDRRHNTLIITPTRELATQIRDELFPLTTGLGTYSTLCIGGGSMRIQDQQLRKRPHFVIGTPGRLKDLINRRMLSLTSFNAVVLDEVDRMLDMGFINEIKELIADLPKERQSLFFSATLSGKVGQIAREFLTNPQTVTISSQKPSENVDQNIIRVSGIESKIAELEKIIGQETTTKTLVFVNTKRIVENVALKLSQKGHRVVTLHGDKPQQRRNTAIKAFKENMANVLVATDVASRGLDIEGISHVINFDKPLTYEDYIHRIGRTGRAGKKGIALTFV